VILRKGGGGWTVETNGGSQLVREGGADGRSRGREKGKGHRDKFPILSPACVLGCPNTPPPSRELNRRWVDGRVGGRVGWFLLKLLSEQVQAAQLH
jgi:hypothetical protein